MVKKPPKKTKTSNGAKLGKIKSWFIKSPWWAKMLFVFLVLVLVSLASTAYQQWQLEKRFSKLDKDIELLLINGEKFKDEKYCAHADVKFGGGWLYCVSSIKNSANLNSIDIENFIKYFKDSDNWKLEGEPASSGNIGLMKVTNIKTGQKCEIDTFVDRRNDSYKLEFFCSENSLRSFYPYRD